MSTIEEAREQGRKALARYESQSANSPFHFGLDDLEAVARDATPGPWIADPPSAWDTDDVGGYPLQAAVRVKDSGSITWDDHGGEVFKPADAEFIAAFDPPTVLALIERVERAEARIAAAREVLRGSSIPPGMTEALFYRALMVRADMTLVGFFEESEGAE